MRMYNFDILYVQSFKCNSSTKKNKIWSIFSIERGDVPSNFM